MLANKISELIKQVTQEQKSALHEPYFNGNEWNYVKECLDTGWVSSVGKFVDRFEKEIADFTGANFAIATSNGTSALHICYLLAGIKPGDEVLVPALTFVGTINPLAYCQAIPHFVDSEERFLGIDIELLDKYLHDITKVNNNICYNKITNRPIRALTVMHTLGHPVDLDSLELLCKKYQIVLIEDAAEAFGSFYKEIHVGHRGLVGALSFNGNKIITTGGGGAILTNDEKLARKAKHITTTAKLSHRWAFKHDEVGFNYRLPNVNAAIGCAQIEQIPDFLKWKRKLADEYAICFSNLKEVRFIKEPKNCKSNYWLNAFILEEGHENLRDEILDILITQGIMVRPLWDLQHTLAMYSNCPRMDLSTSENLYKRLIKIPSGVKIAITNQERE